MPGVWHRPAVSGKASTEAAQLTVLKVHHEGRNGFAALCSRKMKPQTEQNILDLAGVALIVAGLVGLGIDVVWGLWTLDSGAVPMGLPQLARSLWG
jgi:hypothetical protein